MHHHNRLEEITSSEYFHAKHRWDEFWRGQVPRSRHPTDFGFFTGITRVRYSPSIMMVCRSSARKVKMLNSPHYHTILMAYKARWS